MFSVAPNILLAPNMTQNAERKHRTQNTNTAHFRSSTKAYSKNMESMDLDKDTTKSRNMCCLFKLLNNEILLKEYVYFTGGKYKVIIASYMSYSSKMIRMRLCGFGIINDIM